MASPVLFGATATAVVSGPAMSMLGAGSGCVAGAGSNSTTAAGAPGGWVPAP